MFYKRQRKKLKILVIRVSDGKLANSKPCVNCIKLMKQANIYKVYYSTGLDDNPVESCLVKKIHSTHVSACYRSS